MVQTAEDEISGTFFCETCKSIRVLQKHVHSPIVARRMVLGSYSLVASIASVGATLWGVVLPLVEKVPLPYVVAPIVLGSYLYIAARMMLKVGSLERRS